MNNVNIKFISLDTFCDKTCPDNLKIIVFYKEFKCKFKHYINYIANIPEKELYHILNKDKDFIRDPKPFKIFYIFINIYHY